jgi:hypothetical protein
MNVVFFLVLALAVAIGGCDRKTDATTKPATDVAGVAATSVSRHYSEQLDETTVASPSIYRDIGGRKIGLSARYTFRGKVPNGPAKTIVLWITSDPKGKALAADKVPIALAVDDLPLKAPNGAPMMAETGILRQTQYYSPELSVADFTVLVSAARGARISVNDLTLDLSAAERADLARLVPELPK